MALTSEELSEIEAHVARIQMHFGETLAVSVTRRCPLRCAHCCMAAVPEGDSTSHRSEHDLPEVIVAQLERTFDQLAGTVAWLSLTGGEPLLRPDVVQRLSQAAAAVGLEVGVVTSSYWATSPERARAVVESLPAVRSWDLSTDLDHLRWVPLTNVRWAHDAALAAGRRVVVRLTTGLGPRGAEEQLAAELAAFAGARVREQDVIPFGRAAARPVHRATSPDPSSLPCCSTGPLIREDGTALPCCNALPTIRRAHPLVLGDLSTTTLASVYRALQTNPLLHYLRLWGVADLVRRTCALAPDAAFPTNYLEMDPCGACAAIMGTAKLAGVLEALSRDPELAVEVAAARWYHLGEPEMLNEIFSTTVGSAVEQARVAQQRAAERGGVR